MSGLRRLTPDTTMPWNRKTVGCGILCVSPQKNGARKGLLWCVCVLLRRDASAVHIRARERSGCGGFWPEAAESLTSVTFMLLPVLRSEIPCVGDLGMDPELMGRKSHGTRGGVCRKRKAGRASTRARSEERTDPAPVPYSSQKGQYSYVPTLYW